MAKKDKAELGSVAELSEIYPAPRTLKVTVVRVEGRGDERKVTAKSRKATVYALPIDQLGRVGMALAADTADAETGMHSAIADVIGWDVEDVCAMYAPDFKRVMNALVELNTDFFRLPRASLESERQETPAGTNGASSEPSLGSKAETSPSLTGSH